MNTQDKSISNATPRPILTAHLDRVFSWITLRENMKEPPKIVAFNLSEEYCALFVQAVNQWDALNVVAEAAEKMLAFYRDLSTSNPGFMSKLTLQDYGQWNEALAELPKSLTALNQIRNAK